MAKDYEITIQKNPSDKDLKILADGLESHTLELFPDKSRTYLALFLRDENRSIVGGVSGNYGTFHWLYIDALWVRDDVRGRGYGAELMDRIESEAINHGCKNAFLNTMSFQAPDFYKKIGYTVFAELDNFPNEHSRIFLRKKLV